MFFSLMSEKESNPENDLDEHDEDGGLGEFGYSSDSEAEEGACRGCLQQKGHKQGCPFSAE